MIKECEKSGMKPICNMGYAQGSCKNDPHALYLGNYYEISYGPYRRITSWFPRGWEGVSGLFAGTCVYTGTQRGNYAKCNTPLNTHNWKLPSQFNPGFVCGKRRPVRVALGALSEFKGGVYEFELRHVASKAGSFSAAMVKECARAKMKPVCNQGSYCKSDKNSIYLGNPSHALSYRPYVSSTSYRSRFPQGFAGPSTKQNCAPR